MIRVITINIVYDIDEELAEKELLEIISKEKAERLIKDQLTNIYCDDIGFRKVDVACRDFTDDFINNLKECKKKVNNGYKFLWEDSNENYS